MKNTPVRIVAALFALVIMVSAPFTASAFNSDNSRITSIGVWSDGHVVIRLSDFPGSVSCPGGGNQFSLGIRGSASQERMAQIAMSAYLSGKRVVVRTLPGQCNGGQEIVNYLEIVN
jgi:hypothetical protein